MTFAVVVCGKCRQPWSVDLRHAASACPNCRTKAELAHRTKLWEGDDARQAQQEAARLRMGGAALDVVLQRPRPVPRHDSPEDAAAARASGIINKSARAEAVALWMTRLAGPAGPVPHEGLVDSMQRAGLDAGRANQEIQRMLAMDILLEPRPGHYRLVEA